MSDEQPLTRSQAIEQTLAQLDGPLSVDELCRRALALWPSRAKNPASAMRSHLHQDHAGKTLVFLDDKTILPLPTAMRGLRFRISLDRREVDRGVLIIHPAFDLFLRQGLDPTAVQLLDDRGHSLPVHVITLPVQQDGLFGKQTIQIAAFDLGHWFRTQGVRRNDHVLVTVEDWTAGRFRLECEPAKRRRQAEIERQDRELADLLFGLLEAARHESIYAYVAIPTAYARLSDPRGYPGSHWIEVLARDPRLRYDGWAIHYSDWRSPLDRMLYDEEESVPPATFSPAQGRQVYRFKTALWRRPGLWRILDIQGTHTLVDFDAALRDAFDHDFSDHMGGFWKRVRRGTGKRFREIDAGDVNPMGGGSGAEVHIAGLELAPGDELKYVYDFGDWIEHRLTLLEIVEPEKGVKYPRIVAQNKPQYKQCESCQARGRETRATWICLECSNRQQREVLICKKCLYRKHEDHYAEEILY